MTLPDALPIGLSDEFAHDASRQSLWQAFHREKWTRPRALACRRGQAARNPGARIESGCVIFVAGGERKNGAARHSVSVWPQD